MPSLKNPSCSSCSLPSTTPGPPGGNGKLPFQTPAFQPGYQQPNKELTPPKNEKNTGKVTVSQGSPQIGNGLNPNRGNDDGSTGGIVPLPLAPNPNVNSPNNLPNRFGSPEQPENFTRPTPNQGDDDDAITGGKVPLPPAHHHNVNSPPNKSESPERPGNPTFNQNRKPSQPNAIDSPKKPIRQIPPKVVVDSGMILVPGGQPIPITDKYPNMQDGLPAGITEHDMLDLLYKFNYTVGFHGHYEKGLKSGAKIGGYFVNGRDGISRVVEYIADENGYRPRVKFINLGLDSPNVPKEETEKSFGLQGFEFTWYPI